jgi:hypothetical protein
MFSLHPRTRILSAVLLSAVLCFGAALPQSALASQAKFGKMIPENGEAVPGSCENAAAGLDSNATHEVSGSNGMGRIPCVSFPTPTAAERSADAPDRAAHGAGVGIMCKQGDDLAWNCKNYESLLKEDLQAMGKNGERIMRARERVLEILDEPNSCSAWFEQKDTNVATLFRSLTFAIDAKGVDLVYAVRGDRPGIIYKHPYVARVIQDGGSYQTITLNLHGAFFKPLAGVLETNAGGGSPRMLPSQLIGVGPYRGGTLEAQVATFLHELGHVEGLLQLDEGDVHGKSTQNTQEMLEHCRREVDGSSKRAMLSAGR